MNFTNLERDFLEDLSQDYFDLWELYQYIRHHRPELSEKAVVKAGRDLISKWSDHGWIRALPEEGSVGKIMMGAETMAYIDKKGEAAGLRSVRTERIEEYELPC